MAVHGRRDPQSTAGPARSAAESAARHNARWYLTGLTASLIGNSAMSLVAGVWVKSLTGSSAAAGVASACAYAPTLLAPIAGLIADRVARRTWLVTVNLFAAPALLTLLLVRTRAQVWLIDAVMVAYGLQVVLADPAEDALFAELFSTEARRRLNGLRLAIQETGRLVAPLLGAGLFVALGGGAVAALDAATFVFAALATSRLRIAPAATRPPLGAAAHAPPERGVDPPPARARLRTELAAGARHIAATPQIRVVAIAATAVMALSGLSVAAQYSLVAALHERPAFLGVLSAVLGGASVLASLACGRLIARLGERRVAVIGIADLALGTLLRAVPWLPAALLGTFVLGFALPFVFLAVLSVAQRESPVELQGRVSAALALALFGPAAPMQALGALLIAHASYAQIYVGLAGASVLVGGWLLATRSSASR